MRIHHCKFEVKANFPSRFSWIPLVSNSFIKSDCLAFNGDLIQILKDEGFFYPATLRDVDGNHLLDLSFFVKFAFHLRGQLLSIVIIIIFCNDGWFCTLAAIMEEISRRQPRSRWFWVKTRGYLLRLEQIFDDYLYR